LCFFIVFVVDVSWDVFAVLLFFVDFAALGLNLGGYLIDSYCLSEEYVGLDLCSIFTCI